MDLHGIARGAISAVNPFVDISVKRSTGSTTEGDGTRVPTYAAPIIKSGQVQPLTYDDLKQLDGLNIAGIRRKIWFEGHIDGLVRGAQQGGDLVTFPDGTIWLVVFVFETWPDWCSVCVTLQNGA